MNKTISVYHIVESFLDIVLNCTYTFLELYIFLCMPDFFWKASLFLLVNTYNKNIAAKKASEQKFTQGLLWNLR